MPIAKAQLETFVSPEELKSVILDFAAYPGFMKEVKRIEVHEQSDELADVTFHIELSFGGFEVKSHYRVRYDIGQHEIRWSLVESPTLTRNVGAWKLVETDDGETRASYEAEVETNLPIPPEVQSAFAQQELPKLMEKIRDRAEDM
jgi:ribosome-associated toxin RatA of RatAB toxin-antitoxin module